MLTDTLFDKSCTEWMEVRKVKSVEPQKAFIELLRKIDAAHTRLWGISDERQQRNIAGYHELYGDAFYVTTPNLYSCNMMCYEHASTPHNTPVGINKEHHASHTPAPMQPRELSTHMCIPKDKPEEATPRTGLAPSDEYECFTLETACHFHNLTRLQTMRLWARP